MLSDPIRYTELEAALVNRLAQVRVRADAGDRRAKAQIAQMVRQLAVLTKQAKRGNARAARMAQVLQESGLLVSSQTFAMEGAATVQDRVIDLLARAAQLRTQADLLTAGARDGARMQATVLEREAAELMQPVGPVAMRASSPWTWKIGRFNALNAALLATAGLLLLKGRWVFAAAPIGVLVAHEGRGKGWW
jgi:hypothetical protein